MASIAERPAWLPLPAAGRGTADPWPAIVALALDWGRPRRVSWRDAVFLVPTAQHLPLARRAWAARGGWMPRVETTLTLAQASAPPPAATQPHRLSFDVTADRLTAADLLRGQAWTAAWAQRDAPGWSQALDALVATAHAFWHAAAALAPAVREAHWRSGSAAAAALTAGLQQAAPGAAERALARIAFEWARAAMAAAAPATDVLFTLTPSACVCTHAAGADPLAVNWAAELAAAGTPCLSIDTDPPPAQPLAPHAAPAPLQVGVCTDFEDEAQRAAAQVLADLADAERASAVPRWPVALISLDRLLVRRVRALLARRGVAIADETGWTLSTTRAAASLVGLLAALRPQASADELLNGLRACAGAWPGLPQGRAGLASLETAMRRHGWSHAAAIEPALLSPSAAALWRACQQAGGAFDAGATLQPLAGWLQRLQALLAGCGLDALLTDDEAGRQVLAALADSASRAAPTPPGPGRTPARHGNRPAAEPSPHALLASVAPQTEVRGMARAQFVDWIDRVLEAAAFLPAAPVDPDVVITPLRRAVLRPFAAIVAAGADDRHLGGAPPRQPLLSDAEAVAFGLPGGAWHREHETLAFAQLLRAAPVTLLHRRDDAGEPLAASPLLARLLLARQAAGVPWQPAIDHRIDRPAGVAPVPRPLPVAPALLPGRLSASACEALRACPYRFFALRVLGLKEAAELDDAVEKRDYGSWLHAVLHRFHVQRADGRRGATGEVPTADAPSCSSGGGVGETAAGGASDPPGRPGHVGHGGGSKPGEGAGVGHGNVTSGGSLDADADAAHLHAVAAELLRDGSLDAAAFLPYRASFDRFVPRYVEWLQRRDAAGVHWLDGEREFSAAPPEWGGTLMHGVIDRIDSADGDDGPLTQLIDYKTGSAQQLREATRRPQEDTQLAFYAGLLLMQSAAVGGVGELRAMYLALDEADQLHELPHADVEASARQLISGIGGDLARLRRGAAMPALGEGRACSFCEARGLCRRDHWSEP